MSERRERGSEFSYLRKDTCRIENTTEKSDSHLATGLLLAYHPENLLAYLLENLLQRTFFLFSNPS